MRKILYITGTRADYGLMRPVLRAISRHPQLQLEIAVTGMHLMKEFGLTVREIEDDGFSFHRINAAYEDDTKASMAIFLGKCMQLLAAHLRQHRPDLLLVLGDRAEMLAAALAGAYMGIPVAHLHGGERTSTVDEFARHAITKLAHFHLPATRDSARRIARMGEERWRIHVVGAPGLDEIRALPPADRRELCARLGFDPRKPIAVVAQHPVSVEEQHAARHMRATLDAVRQLGLQTIIIYPNADAGGRRMIQVIGRFRHTPEFRIFKSIPHSRFLILLQCASVLIGNSSSGIIEAPSLKLPAVNIGTRQQGRERAANVIDVPCEPAAIARAIRRALSGAFRTRLTGKNPYGDGKTGARVARLLATVPLGEKLLQKRMSY